MDAPSLVHTNGDHNRLIYVGWLQATKSSILTTYNIKNEVECIGKRKYKKTKDIDYWNINMNIIRGNTRKIKVLDAFNFFWRTINWIQNRTNSNILIHCRTVRHRAPTLAIAYLLCREKEKTETSY